MSPYWIRVQMLAPSNGVAVAVSGAIFRWLGGNRKSSLARGAGGHLVD